ncbi:protein kinase domain-containing protein [Streptomyces sp. WG7]|uniref:protein kinase domain-containing protein n=1 Tax=Streptomyces sp. WG7 TaxID=3417650 RepID=UPI003CF9C37F
MNGLEPGDPEWIGTYRLLGRLGEGGMGRVYLARSDRGRTVAVKTVREELARQPDFRRRFAQEVRAAQRVGGEWTAPVLDADTQAPTPWVATGYVAGPSLAEVVDQQYGPLPPSSLRVLAVGLVRALQTIHGAGLVHRDLKPSNILVTIDGPRVIDFGIARALDVSTQSADGFTRTGAVVGSPGFMSPEQVRGEKVSYASDIFCLGAVLAYAAMGRMPFGTAEGGMHSLLFRIATEEADLSGTPEAWHGLIAACLVKDPDKRPTPDELLTSIEDMEGADAAPGGAWLPGEVLAELGRHAVQLLDSEDPEKRLPVGAPVAGFGPPPTAYGLSTPPGPVPTPFGARPGPQQAPVYSTPAPVPASAPTSVSPTPFARRPVRPLRGLAMVLNAFLGVFALLLMARGAVLGGVFTQLGRHDAQESPHVIEGFDDWALASDLIDSLSALAILGVAGVWVCWFRHVWLNADALAPGRIRYSPGLAAGGWFIPVVNFYLPKQIANDIWTATTGRPKGAGRWLLHTWWWFWLAHFTMFANDSFRAWNENDLVEGARESILNSQSANGVGVVSAVLAMALVTRLTSLQRNRAAQTA